MNYKFLTLLLFSVLLLTSCGEKKAETAEEEEMIEWKELDEFHAIMADVFHPLKDSGNIAVYMSRAGELADAAEKWAAAPLPEKVNNDEVKSMIEELKKGSRQVADEIANGAEEDYAGTELHKLHDQFHKIQEAWYSDGKEGHEHH